MESAAPPAPDGAELEGVRHSRDAKVMQGLRPALACLSALFVLSAFVHPLTLPEGVGLPVGLADAAAGLFLDLLFVTLTLRWAKRLSAHGWALLGALVAVAGFGMSLALTRDPAYSLGLVLLQLGCGLLFLSWPSLAAVLALADAAWLGVAAAQGFPTGWLQAGLLVAAATALACAAHAVRLRGLVRTEALKRDGVAAQLALRRSLHEQEAAVAQARTSEQRLHAVAQAAFDGLCVHDGTHVVDANPALATLLGTTVEALVGRPLLDLVEPTRQQEAADRLIAPIDAPLETVLVRSDGTRVPVHLRGGKLPMGHHVVSVRDLTPHLQAEESARLAAERLAELEGLKEVHAVTTRFVNMASHELRMPLTPILLQVRLLGRRGPLDGQQERALTIIHRNLARLTRLMQDMMDSCRIQADRLRLERARVDLEMLARDAVQSVQDLAQEKGLALRADLEPDTWVLADQDRIHQVLSNLLSNAVKFTPPGGRVEVTLRRARDGVFVQVSDTGVGVRPEDQERLFLPFSQVHEAPAVAGSGLGLHISKGLVERHGGALWCESDGPGKGARFCFTLPLDTSAGPGPGPIPAGG
jgi:PAS domain S-box-containing protein